MVCFHSVLPPLHESSALFGDADLAIYHDSVVCRRGCIAFVLWLSLTDYMDEYVARRDRYRGISDHHVCLQMST